MPRVRLLIDPPAAGGWNMAVDEVLLQSAAGAGVGTLRFYAWSQPTLSLGYFQYAAERQSHPASLNCPLVRRASGGGAIVHDRELTYSLAWPLADRFGSQAGHWYDMMHAALINALAALRLDARPANAQLHEGSPPFLCFQRRAAGDVLIGAHKIAGSAQRRHHGALLQHGSVLLDRSRAAPELPGIAQLGCSLSGQDLQVHWLPEISRITGWELIPGALTREEIQAADDLQRAKFDNLAWTYRRDAADP